MFDSSKTRQTTVHPGREFYLQYKKTKDEQYFEVAKKTFFDSKASKDLVGQYWLFRMVLRKISENKKDLTATNLYHELCKAIVEGTQNDAEELSRLTTNQIIFLYHQLEGYQDSYADKIQDLDISKSINHLAQLESMNIRHAYGMLDSLDNSFAQQQKLSEKYNDLLLEQLAKVVNTPGPVEPSEPIISLIEGLVHSQNRLIQQQKTPTPKANPQMAAKPAPVKITQMSPQTLLGLVDDVGNELNQSMAINEKMDQLKKLEQEFEANYLRMEELAIDLLQLVGSKANKYAEAFCYGNFLLSQINYNVGRREKDKQKIVIARDRFENSKLNNKASAHCFLLKIIIQEKILNIKHSSHSRLSHSLQIISALSDSEITNQFVDLEIDELFILLNLFRDFKKQAPAFNKFGKIILEWLLLKNPKCSRTLLDLGQVLESQPRIAPADAQKISQYYFTAALQDLSGSALNYLAEFHKKRGHSKVAQVAQKILATFNNRGCVTSQNLQDWIQLATNLKQVLPSTVYNEHLIEALNNAPFDNALAKRAMTLAEKNLQEAHSQHDLTSVQKFEKLKQNALQRIEENKAKLSQEKKLLASISTASNSTQKSSKKAKAAPPLKNKDTTKEVVQEKIEKEVAEEENKQKNERKIAADKQKKEKKTLKKKKEIACKKQQERAAKKRSKRKENRAKKRITEQDRISALATQTVEYLGTIPIPQPVKAIFDFLPNAIWSGSRPREAIRLLKFEGVSSEELTKRVDVLLFASDYDLYLIGEAEIPEALLKEKGFTQNSKMANVYESKELNAQITFLPKTVTDFTITSIYTKKDGRTYSYHPQALKHLELKEIHTVEDTVENFSLNQRSIFRYLRLLTLGYTETYSPSYMKQFHPHIQTLSSGMLYHQLSKNFMSGKAAENFDQLKKFGFLNLLFPKIDEENWIYVRERLVEADQYFQTGGHLKQASIFAHFVSARYNSDKSAQSHSSKEHFDLSAGQLETIMQEFNFTDKLREDMRRLYSRSLARDSKVSPAVNSCPSTNRQAPANRTHRSSHNNNWSTNNRYRFVNNHPKDLSEASKATTELVNISTT